MHILFIAMFAMIFIGVPVAFSIFGSSMIYLLVTGLKPLSLVCQRAVTGLDSFPLLAVPLFVFVGDLMDRGGISKRMVRACEAWLGWIPGGLGVVTISACAIFAALTGSGPATVAAIGSIMIPSLVKNGYKKETAAGMAAAGGALGPIIPPSIPMIIYGITMGVSIPDMFMAGVVPGLVIMLLLIGVNMVIAFRSPEIMQYKGERFDLKNALKATADAFAALLLPVIILGGIYSGVFTPTESAAIGVVYSLFIGIFVYKEIKIKDLPASLVKSMETAAMVDFIISAANMLSWAMAVSKISDVIIAGLSVFVVNKYIYLLILMLLLFFVGALMDTVAAIIIIAPIIVPMGLSFGLDPLHLGCIFVMNLVIGYVTPPFGYNLFTACSVTGLSFNKVVKGVIPFLLTEMAAILLFAYVPQLVTWLPSIL